MLSESVGGGYRRSAAGSVFSALPVRGGVAWTPQRVTWSAMLMAWGEQEGVVERFHAITALLKKMRPHWRLGNSYEGWLEALRREQERLVPLVTNRLREKMQACHRYQKCGRWEAYAVDGSDMTCPRTVKNQTAMGNKGKQDGMPLASLTCIFHMRLGLPWAFRVGPGTDSERGHLREMLADLPLPQGSLLVADAGFIGYSLCCELIAAQQHFLLRIGGNVHLFKELGYEHEIVGQTVYLWPLGQQKKNQPPLELRLIVVQDESKQPVYLVTSVLNTAALTNEEAGDLYQQRWGVEVHFRTVKQTMEHYRLRSRTPENCYLELTWIFLGVWLLELLALDKVVGAGGDPRDLSPAKARTAVRRVMRDDRPDHRSRRSLAVALAGCRKDRYQRTGCKATRPYPRKKRQQPPGPPNIKPPGQEQLQKATGLTPIKMRN